MREHSEPLYTTPSSAHYNPPRTPNYDHLTLTTHYATTPYGVAGYGRGRGVPRDTVPGRPFSS